MMREYTEVYIGNGMTQIYPVSPDEMCPVVIAGAENIVLDAELEEIDQGPRTDIMGIISRQVMRENWVQMRKRKLRRRKIKRAIVPVLALIALFLLAITPDSFDMLPAGARPTMLIIVALAAAAYLVLIYMANYRKGVMYDAGRKAEKHSYVQAPAEDRSGSTDDC